MALRRCICTLMGITGSCLTIIVLCLSVRYGYSHGEGITIFMLDESLQRNENIQNSSNEEHVTDSISLPVNIPGTPLILERLVSYEGPFLEDYSDREVVNVSAVHLYNTGDEEVLCAEVELQFQNVLHQFYAEYIPAGKAILVLEKNAMKYEKTELTGVRGWGITNNTVSAERQNIQISEQGMGVLSVSNFSGRQLRNVALFYKSWLSDPEIYVGGIAYSVQIPVLEAGETVSVYPYHYARGYSKVVSIKTD